MTEVIMVIPSCVPSFARTCATVDSYDVLGCRHAADFDGRRVN